MLKFCIVLDKPIVYQGNVIKVIGPYDDLHDSQICPVIDRIEKETGQLIRGTIETLFVLPNV